MLDINFIRQNPDKIKKAVLEKGLDFSVDLLLEIDQERRKLLQEVEDLRRQKNEASERMDIKKGKGIKSKLDDLEEEFTKKEKEYLDLMVKVPTIPSPDTPKGKNDQDNVEVFSWGEKPKFAFAPRTHIELGKQLDILDFEAGAKVAGYRGYYLKNEGVMVEMALIMLALNKLIAKGFTPIIPPTLVKGFALFGSGYFKGREYNSETDEIYQVMSSDKEASGKISQDVKFLVGTAEPTMLAYYANEVLKAEQLPIKMVGFSQCYRSEIGSYGKDTKGLYRVHEFFKVEQVVITKADIAESDKWQKEMVAITKELHEELGLPYRIIQICTGDLSVGKYRQFDFEAWMPGLNRYGETGSASSFLDWQANRLGVKYEENGQKKAVYMLNNTALPTPRPIIAILENFQKEDGSVIIPEVLRKYTGFSEIKPKR